MDDAEVNTPEPMRQECCLVCDYDLTSLPDGLCPECGAAFTHAQLRDAAIQRGSKFRKVLRILIIRGGTCILAAMAFGGVAVLCGMAALGSVTLAAIAIVGASLFGAIIDQCLSHDRPRPMATRARTEFVVACTVSLFAAVSNGWVSAPFVTCVLTIALCQVWRANGRDRWALILAMPGVCLLVLAFWITLTAQVRIMQGFRFSDWNVRNASIAFRAEAMPAVEARRQGFVVGGMGLVALVPWYARRVWERARRKESGSEAIADSRISGDGGSSGR